MGAVVGIVAKSRQEKALSYAGSIIQWLTDRGFEYRVDAEVQAVHRFIDAGLVVPRERIAAACSVLVVLGGDGTLLSVARFPADPPPIIIGVNIGTLGFLTNVSPDSMFEALELALSGKANVQSRSLLSARVSIGGREKSRFHALNDIVVTKDAVARLFGLGLFVDGEYAATVRGDGLIVSSPSGSTAYSLSAGGSIVHPEVRAILLTPICPHSVTSRPLVLPAASTIGLRVEESESETNEVFLSIDGQEGMPLTTGAVVTIETSPYQASFLKLGSYFEALGTKLKWSNY